jgi:hypothetical protein
MYIFKNEMQRRRKFFTLNELKSKKADGAKDMRIRGLIPLYRNGQIFHRPWMKRGELEIELAQFPFGRLKDRIDALSYKLQAISPPILKPRREYQPVTPNSLTGY